MYTNLDFIDPDSIAYISTCEYLNNAHDPSGNQKRVVYEIGLKNTSKQIVIDKDTPLAEQVERLIKLLNNRHGSKNRGIDIITRGRASRGAIYPDSLTNAIGEPIE